MFELASILLAAVAGDTVPTWLLPAFIIWTLMQFFWSSVITVVMYRIAKTDRSIDGFRREVHELTTKLVDERFRAMTHEVNNHVQAFNLTLESLSRKLEATEGSIGELSEGDHGIEMRLAGAIGSFKEDVAKRMGDIQIETMRRIAELMGNVATKQDLDRLREDVNRGR